MDVPLLRKMTEKSIIGFGKYKDVSVGNLLAFGNNRQLRWIYYNCSKLSFTDEILDKIGIGEENRIEKPGVNKELHEKVNQEKDCNMSPIIKLIQKRTLNARARSSIQKHKINDRSYFSKVAMQAYNHGH